MSISRREFMKLAASASLAVGASSVMARNSFTDANALMIPPLLESVNGHPLFLVMQICNWSFRRGTHASVWGMNGRYLGPTIRVMRDDYVKLVYSNRLPESVSMTVSGLQVIGALNGGAHRLIAPNAEWAPVLSINQPAATCWYHASTPRRAGAQLYQGLAGLWLIEDNNQKNIFLPHHYGVDDFPIIIQDKRLDSLGAPLYQPTKEGFLGDQLLVNGTINPFIQVSRGWIRLRLLNGSNSRRYHLQFSDKRDFIVIAGDQGLLSASVKTPQLSLAPGERREILIDLSNGEEVTLNAGASATIVERVRGFFEPSSSLTSTQIVRIIPSELMPIATRQLVSKLTDLPEPGTPVIERFLDLGDDLSGINGKLWDPRRIDLTVQQGSYEKWMVTAKTPQPFSISGARFLIQKVNGSLALAEDRGWKDTVWVEGKVELLVYFPNSSSQNYPFRYGSQNMERADQGVQGQFNALATKDKHP